MRIIALVQARLNSTRLPRKVLARIGGKSALEILVERLAMARQIDEIIVAMPHEPQEDYALPPLNGLAEYFIDSDSNVNDVAGRFAKVLTAIRQEPPAAFVRVCADSPFLDPAIVDQLVTMYVENALAGTTADIVSNTRPITFPAGQCAEVVNTEFFRQHLGDLSPYGREHVTAELYERAQRVVHLTTTPDLSRFSLVLDTQEDLERLRRMASRMTADHREYGWRECLRLAY